MCVCECDKLKDKIYSAGGNRFLKKQGRSPLIGALTFLELKEENGKLSGEAKVMIGDPSVSISSI